MTRACHEGFAKFTKTGSRPQQTPETGETT